MIKKALLLLQSMILAAAVHGQVFWTETFENGCTSACDVSGYTSGPNGAWTVTSTGTNGFDANNFYVSCAEPGFNAGQCSSSPCAANNATLYVGVIPSLLGFIPDGATYLAGGLGFWFPQTDKRAESPSINCTGKSNITLAFNYIENGQGSTDNATLWYFDGSTWTQLSDMNKTTVCGSGEGTWTAFTITLPASADNNPGIKIGFRWVNNDDNQGTDPSFAVNDITLSAPGGGTAPTAAFTASATTVCTGGCINFTNTSTGGPFTTTSWTFTGATPSSSNANNPTNICYNAPGTYQVSLTVTNANGTDTETIAGYITVSPPPTTPTPSSNSPLCAGNSINLSTPTIGGATYAWTGPNGFTSTDQNPVIANSTVAMSGTYSVIASVGTCSSPAGTVSVTVNASPAAPVAASNSPICEGSTLNLTASTVGGATYTWTGPNGFTSSDQNPTIPSATSAMSGNYSVVTNAAGCSSQPVTVNVIISALPNSVTASSNSPVCAGSDLNLTATTVSGATYNWSGPNGFTSNQQNPTIPAASSAISGTYSVTIQIGTCISNPATTTVTVSTAPGAPTAGNNSPVCAGSSINLTATGVSGATFSWTGPNGFTSNSQNPVIPNAGTLAGGVYSVTQTVAGCTSAPATTSVTINPAPATPTVTSNSPVCAGSTIVLSAPTIPNVVYSWTGPNGFTSSQQNPSVPNASATNTGVYTLTVVSTTNGCASAPANVLVGLGDGLPITITPNNPVIDLGETVQLTATGATNYSWSPSTALSCSNCANPIASPVVTTTYEVTGTDAQGCTGTAFVIVFVEAPCSEVFVPTVFSPNGDELNDLHCVFGTCIIDLEIAIFNRWGQQVFQSTNKSECWDGTFNGKDVEPGVYVYTVRAMQSNGIEVKESGNINVIR